MKKQPDLDRGESILDEAVSFMIWGQNCVTMGMTQDQANDALAARAPWAGKTALAYFQRGFDEGRRQNGEMIPVNILRGNAR